MITLQKMKIINKINKLFDKIANDDEYEKYIDIIVNKANKLCNEIKYEKLETIYFTTP